MRGRSSLKPRPMICEPIATRCCTSGSLFSASAMTRSAWSGVLPFRSSAERPIAANAATAAFLPFSRSPSERLSFAIDDASVSCEIPD
jgi:hypothetical protein